jgi:hypothetical protein
MAQAQHLGCYLLQVASQVWRDECFRCSEVDPKGGVAKSIGAGEQPFEANSGRDDAGCCGSDPKGGEDNMHAAYWRDLTVLPR